MSVETAATILPDQAQRGPVDEWVGRIIGERYRLLEKLGEGGMGAVYLAEHLGLRKQVALKTIHSTFEGHVEIAARFAREAMVSARIEHPNVVAALDYGTLDSGGAYLVMQLVRGEDLRQRIHREGALPWRTACEIVEQIADAVVAAHAAGIVHRDLKPENVLLEAGSGASVHVKVLDFGIAHLREGAGAAEATTSGAPLTQLGVVIGTPGYMAPEQALGQPIDERADIYAMGVMLWELVAGQQPFQGQTLTEIVTKQFGARPPPLPSTAQPVPDELAQLIEHMLASTDRERPQSAAEVRDRLHHLRATELAQVVTQIAWPSKLARFASVTCRGTLAPLANTAHRTINRWASAATTEHKLALAAGVVLACLLLWGAFSAATPGDEPAAGVVQTKTAPRERAREPKPERARSTQAEAADGEQDPDESSERPKERVKEAATRVRDGVKRLFR